MRIIHCAWAAALLSALAAGSCAKDTAGNGGTGTTESYNDKIDSYLAERYLWNSEYGQMTRDLTIEPGPPSPAVSWARDPAASAERSAAAHAQ